MLILQDVGDVTQSVPNTCMTMTSVQTFPPPASSLAGMPLVSALQEPETGFGVHSHPQLCRQFVGDGIPSSQSSLAT